MRLTYLHRRDFSRNLLGLYGNRLLQSIASAMLGVFLPIFLYEQFDLNLRAVLWYFLVSFLLYFALAPLGAKVMSRVGQLASLYLSFPFFIAYFLCLYFFSRDPAVFLLLTAVSITGWRILYWVPYHTDFAEFTDRMHRGRQVGFLESVYALISIVVPITAGFLISRFGFDALFILLLILVVLSLFPLLVVRPTAETYSYSYLQSFRELIKPAHRKMFVAYAADGADTIVGLAIWPVFVYLLLDGKYLEIGGISSLIIITTIIVRLATGALTDQSPKRRVLRFGSIVYATGWIAKALATTGSHIFAAGAYHNIGTVMLRTTFDTMMYERAADNGHYVDEYTVLREQALNVGRILMLLLLLILVGFVHIPAAFIIAAGISLLRNLLSDDHLGKNPSSAA